MFGKISGIILGCILGLAGMTVLLGSWYTIDQGERGVILRNGKITSTAQPGLGFKMPIIDEVAKISTQSKSRIYDNVETYSGDQQPATLVLSVNYRLPADSVSEIYEKFGSEEGLVSRVVDRKVFEHVKNVFGQFNAATAIQERGRLNIEISTAIQGAVKGPVIIESVQIENIDFSDTYEASIEARMLAEVEVQKRRQEYEREKVQAEITVTQAKAEAEGVRQRAMAEADAIKLRGEAEAAAVEARGKALRDNPNVIQLVQAEKWNGTLPQTMVPGSAVPFVNVR